jgi:hypothetical protein
MKKMALMFLLLQTTLLLAAADKPNPADFPVKVHVVSSAATEICGGAGPCAYIQVLVTVIDSQPIELQGNSDGVLALGDYPARISSSIHARNKHPNSYDIYRGYDLLMPDGTARTYTVTRIGPVPTHP